jgi:hypothetical protein
MLDGNTQRAPARLWRGRLAHAAGVFALASSVCAWSAPLFERTDGSLSPALTDAARTAGVLIDRATVRAAAAGSEIEVALPEAGTFRYRVVQRVDEGEVVRLDGVMIGSGSHHLTLGVREEGVTGVIETPAGTYSLGYVNGRQWVAAIGEAQDWRALQDGGRPPVFTGRSATQKDTAPVPGAQPIEVNLAQLTALQPGDEATLPLADLGPLRVRYDDTHANADSATWVGHLKDYGQDFRVVLTYSPAGTVGHILTPRGDYAIQSDAAGAAYLIDPRKLGMRHVEGDAFCPAPPGRGARRAGESIGNAAATTSTATVAADVTPLPGSTVVDVLVLYTSGFVTDKGGTAGASAAIDHLIAISNQAYRDSGVALMLRRVGAEQVSVSDQTSNSTTLANLTNGTGPFANVKTRRNALGADLVTLVRPFWQQYQAGCGTGWIGGYGGAPITGSSGYAYSVVSEGRDRAGSGWYCDVTSFTHELGHNMGLMHDRATVSRQGGGQGATAYAYGYGIDGTFGTVMSYMWPKLGKFSNPRDYTCAGNLRCGVPDTNTTTSADNTKALGVTRTGVAAFRSSTVQTQLTISGTVTVNGAARSGVTISGASCSLSGTNGVYQCKVNPGFSGVLTPSSVVNGAAVRFSPASRTYTSLQSSAVNQNFAGTR